MDLLVVISIHYVARISYEFLILIFYYRFIFMVGIIGKISLLKL